MRRNVAVLLVVVCLNACHTSRYQLRGTEPARKKPIALKEFVGTDELAHARQIDTESRSIESFDGFTVGVLEIGDDGNINDSQKKQVVTMIRDKMAGNGGLVVVFVHGWHHGPRTCDRDLCCFRRVMEQIAAGRAERLKKEAERLGKEYKPQNVVGLYVGWRGESIAIRGVNLTTIHNRKKVAERIGRTAGKEILLELDDLWNENHNMKLVSVGHSLGGAFLFKAAKGKMTGNVSDIEEKRIRSYRVARAKCDREEAYLAQRKAIRAGIGDVMVLVNPAIEASEYVAFDKDLKDSAWSGKTHDQLVAARQPYDKNVPYDERQLPVLVTLASKADSAVGVIFPIARYLTGNFSQAAVRGLGHYVPFVTHQLKSKIEPITDEEKTEREPRQRNAKACDCSMLAENLEVPGRDLDLARSGERQTFGSYVLELDPRRAQRGWDPHSPYYVIQTTEKIAAEHSDIFNKEFVGFLVNFIDAFERAPSYDRNRGCPAPVPQPSVVAGAVTATVP
jgi:hypothetical protein